MFGLPINQGFDGMHHGSEKADLKYSDRLFGVGNVRLGIHVKSYDKNYKKLGRGSLAVKGLYAQLGFSLYQVIQGNYPFDILGISVPQEIHSKDMKSMKFLSLRAGIPLLTMQRTEWLKVAEAAYESLQF
jgi:hypothetical protein